MRGVVVGSPWAGLGGVMAVACVVLAGCGSSADHVESVPASSVPMTVTTAVRTTPTSVAHWFVPPPKSTGASVPPPQPENAPTVLGPSEAAQLPVRATTLAAAFLHRLPAGYALTSASDTRDRDGTVTHFATFRAADGIGRIAARWQQLTRQWPLLSDAENPNTGQSYSKSKAGETLVLNTNPPIRNVMFVTPSGSMVDVLFTLDPKAFRTAYPGQPEVVYPAAISKDDVVAIAQVSAA